jgi:hypothetical protein
LSLVEDVGDCKGYPPFIDAGDMLSGLFHMWDEDKAKEASNKS